MPTYVYRCEQCNYHFEQIQKFSDAPLKACPRCNGHVRRVIHPTGIVFKGSGWYINDSRKGSSKPSESTSSSESTPSTPSTDKS
jgi:putative FmdB family regulatory protein